METDEIIYALRVQASLGTLTLSILPVSLKEKAGVSVPKFDNGSHTNDAVWSCMSVYISRRENIFPK